MNRLLYGHLHIEEAYPNRNYRKYHLYKLKLAKGLRPPPITPLLNGTASDKALI